MHIEPFYDPTTFTLSYVVFDPSTRDAVIIDPVLEYDPVSSTTNTAPVQTILDYVHQHDLKVHYLLETHAHADHLSGSPWLRTQLGARTAIGAEITEVQRTFKGVFDLPDDFSTEGAQFDRLLHEGEIVEAGSLAIKVLSTPGHTPACVSYLIRDAVFTGDALFLEDYGTGRCDFPRGDAEALYDSVHDRLYRLPDATRVFVGHDYQPGGRPVRWESTIGKQKAENVHLNERTRKEAFVEFRRQRDQALDAPRLLYPSVQINIDGGRLPPAHANGHRYLRIPLNLRKPTNDDGTPHSS